MWVERGCVTSSKKWMLSGFPMGPIPKYLSLITILPEKLSVRVAVQGLRLFPPEFVISERIVPRKYSGKSGKIFRIVVPSFWEPKSEASWWKGKRFGECVSQTGRNFLPPEY
jgi:hypothetical protein